MAAGSLGLGPWDYINRGMDYKGRQIGVGSRQLGQTECAYCNHDVPDEGNYVPEVGDGVEWDRMAAYHDPECEWILTRAHRQEDV